MSVTTRIIHRQELNVRRPDEFKWRLYFATSPDRQWNDRFLLLPGGGAEVGREPVGGNDALTIQDDGLSRRHFALVAAPGRDSLQLRDLGSRNGTFVDGVSRVSAELVDGSVVRTGHTVIVVDRWPLSIAESPSTDAVIGRSSAASKLRSDIVLAGSDTAPVWLGGETGTGKERIAAAVHGCSKRPGQLVRVNVAAIPAALFESELFGHVRGAFSGAVESKLGRFREAHRGTLVLDEIGELPMEMQPKLLRILEDGVVRPVGGTTDIATDVRVIASTNIDADIAIASGRFRADLAARLRGRELLPPPLRSRRADLLDMADVVFPHPVAESRWSSSFTAEAMERLLLHGWPENLRGLRRLLIMLGSKPDPTLLDLADLPPSFHENGSTSSPSPDGAVLHALSKSPTKSRLLELLAAENGNVEAMARTLGCDRRQVHRWLRSHQIDANDVARFRL